MKNAIKILIVDDEPEMIEILQELLEAEGYEVRYAEDGQKGLDALEIFTPDLIILDMNMPNLGGVNFYHEIYDHKKKRARYPVFILTGKHEMEAAFDGLNLEGFFTKPFVADELLKEIYKVTHEKIYSKENSLLSLEKHALVVEDQRELGQSITLEFLDSGYTVDLVNGPDGAIEKIKAKQPSIVLIQLNVNDGSGELLAETIRREYMGAHIAIILYSDPAAERALKIDSEALQCMKIPIPIKTQNPHTLLKASEAVLTHSEAA